MIFIEDERIRALFDFCVFFIDGASMVDYRKR